MPHSYHFFVRRHRWGARSRYPDAEDAARPEAQAPTLQVVHVASERHLLAGFAVGDQRFATATKELLPLLVGVVEGFPMLATEAPPAGAPYVVLTGRGYTLAPDPIDSSIAVAPGEAALIAGFSHPHRAMTPIEYLDLPASVVSGRVSEVENGGAAVPPRYVVLVPEGEYDYFIGGPVASRGADGQLRVWGVVLAWDGRVLNAGTRACRLEVARLSLVP